MQKNKDGGFLTPKEARRLNKEIESNYTDMPQFGPDDKDIRKAVFNYDNPYMLKIINNIDFRIVQGLVETDNETKQKRNTYLLYANGEIIGKFYSLLAAKKAVDNI